MFFGSGLKWVMARFFECWTGRKNWPQDKGCKPRKTEPSRRVPRYKKNAYAVNPWLENLVVFILRGYFSIEYHNTQYREGQVLLSPLPIGSPTPIPRTTT